MSFLKDVESFSESGLSVDLLDIDFSIFATDLDTPDNRVRKDSKRTFVVLEDLATSLNLSLNSLLG